MKVAFFVDSYHPCIDGAVRSIDTFSEELYTLGHQVFVFAPRYGRAHTREESVFRFHSLPFLTYPGYKLAIPFSPRLKATLKRLQIDIIHVHSPFLLGSLGARCARNLDLPLVFTYHTLFDHYVHYLPVPLSLARNLVKKLTQKLYVRFCNRCDMVLVPSQVIGDYLLDLGVKAPVTKLPTGIKVEKFAQGNPDWLRKNYGIGTGEKVLLFVGRLGQEKNIGFLLRSYRRVLDNVSGVKTRLVLVGGGPEAENLRTLAGSLGLTNQVVFTGLVSSEEVVHCYAGADLFVFSSVTETQGLVIGEAKAAGLPAIAVNAFGVREMIRQEEDGFLTPLNEEIFADRIGLLLTDQELHWRMASAARKNIQELSVEVLGKKLENIYRTLIEN